MLNTAFFDNELVTIRQASKILKVHPETLRRWDNLGKLKATRVGGRGHRKYSIHKIKELIEETKIIEIPIAIQQQIMYETRENSCHEVSSFPVENIPIGATYTFTPETAKQVRDWTHGMHIYPAKFIPQIPKWSFQFAKIGNGAKVLDPFCGCGTTLVEALVSGYNAYGIDINPLAQILTRAKTTPLYTDDLNLLYEDIEFFVKSVQEDKTSIDFTISTDELNLHSNWQFWFPKESMEKLLIIKRKITMFHPNRKGLSNKDIENIRYFYLACLSSIVKKCSFFDEKEIKVRKDKSKTIENIPNPINMFKHVVKQNLIGLVELSKQIKKMGASYSLVIGKNAQNIELPSNSVDLISTSPPYINAIDYAMAHKYSLFVLGLISPEGFKDHCREYIGVTERAVRTKEYNNIPLTRYKEIDELILKFKDSKSPVDKIRAFIISEYFIDMKEALKECYRVLKPNSYCVFVVGDNIIRKTYVPTGAYLQNIATSSDIGFELITFFYHQLRNRRLKVNRNVTGGLIKSERVFILKKH